LFDGYPALVVQGLLAAAQIWRRRQLAEQGVALAVAVSGALDLALNRGKGKVLERWLQEVSEDNQGAPRKKPRMSDRAMAFFTAMPRRQAR
jgi:hypothetical protein